MSAKNRGDRIVELIRENTELRFRLHGMIRTNADLIKRIEEDQAVYEQVINERCAGDEQHCTCVPHLRRRITELETQLAALQHEYLVVVTSRAHARAEWERLEAENARLVDRVARLEEIIHAARTALDEVIIAPPRGTKADGRVVPKIDPDLGW